MTSLTYAVVLITGLAYVMVGKAQQTVEPLYLDTTLVPVVELSIRNVARSSASSIHDVYTVSKATRVLHDTAYTRNSPVPEVAVSSSSKVPTTVTEYTHGLDLDSTLAPSNLVSQGTTVGMLSPVSSPDTSIMPSFTAETVTPHSFTKFIPPVLLDDVTSTVLQPSESSIVTTPSFYSVLSGNETLSEDTSTHADGGTPDMSSHMPLEKSESGVQLHKSTESPGTTWQVSAATSTNWYISATESISNGRNMIYGVRSATISASPPDATSSMYDDAFKTKVVEPDNKPQGHNHQDTIVHPKRLGFVLKKRCIDDGTLLETSEKLNEQLMGMLNNTVLLNENQSAFICERVFHVTVPIKNITDSLIKETIQNLTKNFAFKESFKLEKIYLYQNDHAKMALFSADAQDQTANFDEYTLSERELIAYIVAGISLGTLIFILLTCCCVRFLCKKQATSLDLCDIPHLNLKLEDYKLTPIPRPTISFSEYGRELFNPSYNEHTPKLEDTILNQQHFATETSSPGARESMSFPREMRTFGGKKSCSRVQSLDARPNTRSGNGWISNSREKLSSDFERRNSGFDNVAFRKWF